MKRPPYSRPPPAVDEPHFVAGPLAAEGDPEAGAPGPLGRRRAPVRRGLAAWACCALVLGVAWALGAQAQEQRRVAEGRLQEALRANAALQAQLDAQTAAEAPKAAVFLQADALDAAEALMAALSEALDRPVSLGQLALHPDEGRVAVRMAADLARSQELGAVLGTIAQILARQPGAWQVQVQVGRPRGPGPSAAALGRWAAVGALAHTLDAALSARPVPWALSVDGGPPGAVRLMLQPTRPGQGGAAAQ